MSSTDQVDLRAVIQVLHQSGFQNIHSGNFWWSRLSEKPLFKG